MRNGANEVLAKINMKWRCGYILLPLISLFSGCAQDNSAKKAFLDEKISCPPPAVEQFEPWGKSGSQHICKTKHGPFVAFENGYVRIRGQYDNGKEVGVWRWYDAAGKVEKEIDYSLKQ
jgi:hypothetical protein